MTDEHMKKIAARWTVTADLILQTAAQIGFQVSDICDSTFERNLDGEPVLRGSTIAGALRSALANHLHGYREPEKHVIIKELFGFQGDRDEGQESRLICFDSCAKQFETSFRDGVSINPVTGTARTGMKFDRQLLLPGACFPLRLDLLVKEDEDERALLSALCQCLEYLSNGEIRFGSRKTRGLGEVCAKDFRAVRYNMKSDDGWLKYAASDYNIVPLHTKPFPNAKEACEMAFDDWTWIKYDDERKKIIVALTLNVDSTLLIRAPGRLADSPDYVHLTENGKAIVSGTSIAGALRSQIGRILRTIQPDSAERKLESLFGTKPGKNKVLTGSRIRISEAVLNDSRSYRQSRIKIDRFTGGTIDTALFDEEPAVQGSFNLELTILKPEPYDAALITLAVRDLLEGFFTIGGGRSIGRGRVTGTALIVLEDGSKVNLCPDGQGNIEIDCPELLSSSLASLWEGVQ